MLPRLWPTYWVAPPAARDFPAVAMAACRPVGSTAGCLRMRSRRQRLKALFWTLVRAVRMEGSMKKLLAHSAEGRPSARPPWRTWSMAITT
jgi:hypothetical protein